uniref:Uncharacterized protein n=1 Tax=Solanum lycopersicum TaxID=4081 RepID=A0A3Q7FLL8_SOLLC
MKEHGMNHWIYYQDNERDGQFGRQLTLSLEEEPDDAKETNNHPFKSFGSTFQNWWKEYISSCKTINVQVYAKFLRDRFKYKLLIEKVRQPLIINV